MHILKRSHVLIIISISLWQQVFSQDSTAIGIGYTHTIYSKLLKENRSYWVYIPASYKDKMFSSNKYPVMILLDGDTHFHSVTGVVQFLSADHKIPEMIVIGVLNTDRTRDLTPTHTDIGYDGQVDLKLQHSGGGDRFLAFLSEELLPHIDSNYRTLPYQVLVGHSAAGNLAVHDFINDEPLFNAYLAIDPNIAWDKRYTVRHLKAVNVFPREKVSRIYLSSAHNTDTALDTTEYRKAQEDFYKVLKTSESSGSCYQIEYFEKENHRSVTLLSAYHGLLFLFNGFYLLQPESIDLPGLKKHYQQISQQWQTIYLPIEKQVNDLAYYNLYTTKDIKKAMSFFMYNTELYPSSYNVWDSLAEGYMVTGNHKQAKVYYQKSLELNPSNNSAIQQLEKLK